VDCEGERVVVEVLELEVSMEPGLVRNTCSSGFRDKDICFCLYRREKWQGKKGGSEEVDGHPFVHLARTAEMVMGRADVVKETDVRSRGSTWCKVSAARGLMGR